LRKGASRIAKVYAVKRANIPHLQGRPSLKSVSLPYRKLAIAQLALAFALMPLIALWPRAGMAVLILPLPGQASRAKLWVQHQGMPLIGRGVAKDSLLMIGRPQFTPFSALGAGALILAAPASVCQTSSYVKEKP
jgi:hypothetical protein